MKAKKNIEWKMEIAIGRMKEGIRRKCKEQKLIWVVKKERQEMKKKCMNEKQKRKIAHMRKWKLKTWKKGIRQSK